MSTRTKNRGRCESCQYRNWWPPGKWNRVRLFPPSTISPRRPRSLAVDFVCLGEENPHRLPWDFMHAIKDLSFRVG